MYYDFCKINIFAFKRGLFGLLFWPFGTSKIEHSATVGHRNERSEDVRKRSETFGNIRKTFANIRDRSESLERRS
jgi:hypothetical protein